MDIGRVAESGNGGRTWDCEKGSEEQGKWGRKGREGDG
jgi:hypothetical protein